MCKIKLLILLLISLLFGSCVQNIENKPYQYQISYISGEEHGLYLKNLLISYLKMENNFNPQSNFIINADLSHSASLYINNINNTSDRENINTSLSINIRDQRQDCKIFEYSNEINQFYIISDTVNFTSNNIAVEEIKKQNTENLVKDFFYNLLNLEPKCQNGQH